MAFYCNGKKGICTDMHTSQFCSRDCKFGDGTGGYHVETRADKIRSMSNEELRNFLDKFRVETYTEPFGKKFCKNCPTTEGTVEGNLIPLRLHECDFADGVCPHGDALVWWLSQPEEVANDTD